MAIPAARLILAAAAGLLVAATANTPLARPDVSLWPTLGVTVRTAGPDSVQPAQFRQVQMDPAGYAAFAKTGAYPDGAIFAVKFYAAALDKSQTPPLYHAAAQTVFALEVIDRKHPDGRRFYMFAGAAPTATPLPTGNACAQCHNRDGTHDGTFAHLYPLTAARAPCAKS